MEMDHEAMLQGYVLRPNYGCDVPAPPGIRLASLGPSEVYIRCTFEQF